MNVDSFTYRSFELYTTNMFLPLSHIDDTMESIKSTCAFRPLHTSSPRNKSNNNTKEVRNSSTPNIRNGSKRDDWLNANVARYTKRAMSIKQKTTDRSH